MKRARAAIQALETQLAHDRIAKEEALRRAEDQRQQLERLLKDERAARQRAEQERDAAIADCQKAEERLRVAMAAQQAEAAAGRAEPAKRRRKAANASVAGKDATRTREVAKTAPTEDSTTVKKRCGRPPKSRDAGSDFVEWWKPGWRDRFR